MFQPIELAYNRNPGRPAEYPQEGRPAQFPQAGQPAQYPQEGRPAQYPQEGRPAVSPSEMSYLGDPLLDKYIHAFIGNVA